MTSTVTIKVEMRQPRAKKLPLLFIASIYKSEVVEYMGLGDSLWEAVGEMLVGWAQDRECCPQCAKVTKFLCGRCQRCGKCCWHLSPTFVANEKRNEYGMLP